MSTLKFWQFIFLWQETWCRWMIRVMPFSWIALITWIVILSFTPGAYDWRGDFFPTGENSTNKQAMITFGRVSLAGVLLYFFFVVVSLFGAYVYAREIVDQRTHIGRVYGWTVLLILLAEFTFLGFGIALGNLGSVFPHDLTNYVVLVPKLICALRILFLFSFFPAFLLAESSEDNNILGERVWIGTTGLRCKHCKTNFHRSEIPIFYPQCGCRWHDSCQGNIVDIHLPCKIHAPAAPPATIPQGPTTEKRCTDCSKPLTGEEGWHAFDCGHNFHQECASPPNGEEINFFPRCKICVPVPTVVVEIGEIIPEAEQISPARKLSDATSSEDEENEQPEGPLTTILVE